MSTEQFPSYVITDPDPDAPAPGESGEMTSKQAAILRDLCEKLGEDYDTALDYHQAAARIEALQARLDD